MQEGERLPAACGDNDCVLGCGTWQYKFGVGVVDHVQDFSNVPALDCSRSLVLGITPAVPDLNESGWAAISRSRNASTCRGSAQSRDISAEDTFEIDIPLTETEPLVRKIAEKVWGASGQNARLARAIVLKLKTKEFNTLTRSLTPPAMPTSLEEFASVALSLFERVELRPSQLFRLVGVGHSNFQMEADSNAPFFQESATVDDRLLSASK